MKASPYSYIKENNVKIYSSKIEALTAQKEAIEKQLDICEEELLSYNKLSKKGIISKEIVKKYEQHVADLQSRKISVLAEISMTKGYILQNERDIQHDKNNYLAEIGRESIKNQDHINTLKAELIINEDELEKLDIVSPTSGIISNVGKYTEDGILPREYPIKSRVVPPIEGRITNISADVITPRYQGEIAHYKARVEFNKENLAKTLAINSIELYPGMMGSGSIDIDSRTFFSYLFEPIKESFSKAFIEQ